MRTSNLYFPIIILAYILFACKDNNDIEPDANDAFVGSQRLITLSSEMDKFSGTDFECVIKAEDGTIFRRRGNHMRSGNTSLLTLDTGLRTGTYRLLALEVPTIENGTDTVWTDYGLGCRVRISAENHSATVLDTFNSEFELVGDGSETNPFIISSAEHLWRLRDFTNSDENNTKLTGKTHFRQECDLRMRDICTSSDRKFGWLPIGSIPENPFRGIYDGNGYKITGLWIHRPNSPGIGLFGFIDQAKISNLTVQNPDIEGNYAVGALVGGIIGLADNIDKGYVRGCVNNSPKIDNKISDSTGGIIGRLNQFDCATCENLINYGEISGANYTGGIIGDIHEEGKAKNFYLKNAVNVGKVTGTGQVGGCVGHYWASGILNLGIETIHYILYCANYGEVNGSNGGNVGGIIGYFNARKAVVSHSANHGKVYGSGNDVKVGGIAGRMGSNDEAGTALPNNMELSYSCNFGEVGSNTGNANVGGLLGWQEQGSPDDETHYMLHNCYNMGIVPTNQDSDNGGVLGCIDHLGEVQNCYNAKKVSHGNGIIGTHKGGSIFYHHNLYVLEDSGKYWCADKFKESDKSKESTYKGFDFKSVWAVSTSTNNGFPYLRDCPYQFKKLE